jgi:hypothetical protein
VFTRQSPQKLKALREHALIESAISLAEEREFPEKREKIKVMSDNYS